MFFRTFFRPTPWTIGTTLLLTLLAAVVLYFTLVCALDGSMGCQTPVWLQMFMIVAVWPTIIAFRLLYGLLESGLVGIIGLLFSGLWMYIVVCVLRWIVLKIQNLRKK